MPNIKPSKKLVVESFDSCRIDSLFENTSTHIENARRTVHRTIDAEMVQAYWLIGKDIFEEE